MLTQVWKRVTAFKERLAFSKGAGGIGCWIGGRVAALPWCKPLILWWIYSVQLGLWIQNVWKTFPELFWKRVPVKWLILCYWPFVLLNPFVVVLPLKVKPNPVFLSSLCFSLTLVISVCVCVFCLGSSSVVLSFLKM